jgi:hypothetical protein
VSVPGWRWGSISHSSFGGAWFGVGALAPTCCALCRLVQSGVLTLLPGHIKCYEEPLQPPTPILYLFMTRGTSLFSWTLWGSFWPKLTHVQMQRR